MWGECRVWLRGVWPLGAAALPPSKPQPSPTVFLYVSGAACSSSAARCPPAAAPPCACVDVQTMAASDDTAMTAAPARLRQLGSLRKMRASAMSVHSRLR